MCDVSIVVKHYNIEREYKIAEAINATEEFAVEEQYYNENDEDDIETDVCCFTACSSELAEYEVADAAERVIHAIRAANGEYCIVGVIVTDVVPEWKRRPSKKRRKHKRRSLRMAA
jgi:hypothetical protein